MLRFLIVTLCRNVSSTRRWEFAAVCLLISMQSLIQHFSVCCVMLQTSAVLSAVNPVQVCTVSIH